MSEDLFYFNGLNAGTGDYLIPPLRAEQLAEVARGESFAPEHLTELKWRDARRRDHYGVKEGVNPQDLAEAGWGVIFAHDVDPAVRAALAPLLDYRKTQANRIKERYREYSGTNGHRPDESKSIFLARQGVGPGPVDPDKVPYYLLIVGPPERIPYSFQFQLDVAYAVGRIHFDTNDEYAQYAQSVVRAETENLTLPRRAAFFGVANPEDGATEQSSKRLVAPLAEKVRASQPDWTVETFLSEEATKSRLEGILSAQDTPALLFTASHGVAFDLGDPRQLKHQGAVVCQDWPGPNATRGVGIPPTMYYAADDVPGDAHVYGLIAFSFACFGAGTPRYDEFAHLRQGIRERTQIAPSSFLARLPKRLLSHPKGGALAVIGHIDRTWGSSFAWNKSIEQLGVFESTVTRLLQGHPVGSAVEFFNERYAELATALSSELEDMKYGKKPDPVQLASLWTANNDARGYAIIGDPAVRLMVGNDKPTPSSQPKVELIEVPNTLTAQRDARATNASTSEPAPQELADAHAKLALALHSWAQAAAPDQPIEISTEFGDARLVSQLRADGGVSTTMEGDVSDHLLKVHARLVEDAQKQRTETIRALILAAQEVKPLIQRSA